MFLIIAVNIMGLYNYCHHKTNPASNLSYLFYYVILLESDPGPIISSQDVGYRQLHLQSYQTGPKPE